MECALDIFVVFHINTVLTSESVPIIILILARFGLLALGAHSARISLALTPKAYAEKIH
jgi:hypothetical protein